MTVSGTMNSDLPSFILTELNSGCSLRVHGIFGVTISRFCSGFPVTDNGRNAIDNLNDHPAVIKIVGLIIVERTVSVHSLNVNNVVLFNSLKNLVFFELHILNDAARQVIA